MPIPEPRTPEPTLTIDVEWSRLFLRRDGVTQTIAVKSKPTFGLLAYLFEARIVDAPSRHLGYRYAHQILAEAPALERTSAASIGKRVSEFLAESAPYAEEILQYPQKTRPPWAIRLPAEALHIANERAYREFLASRRNAPSREPATAPADAQTRLRTLVALEALVVRGVLPVPVVTDAEVVLDGAFKSTDLRERERASWLRSGMNVRAGHLAAAERDARALVDSATEPLFRARAQIELGAVHYRRREFEEARTAFQSAFDLLPEPSEDDVLDPVIVIRVDALLRLSHVAYRTSNADETRVAARRARDAAERAGERSAAAVAHALELRAELKRIAVPGTAYRDQALAIAERLRIVAGTAPTAHPRHALFIRRYWVEALYAAGDFALGDRVALAVARDALELGSVRDVDAIARLAGQYDRDEVRRALPVGVRRARRDLLDDVRFSEGMSDAQSRDLRR